MASTRPALLVVTGLSREAEIAAGDGVVTLCSGGDPELLRSKLSALSRPHPEDPLPNPPPPAGEGGEGVSRRMGPPSSFETRPAGAPQDEGGFSAILSFGLAGGLAPHLKSGDVVIASHVITGGERHEAHADWHQAIASAFGGAPRLHHGAIAGNDAVLTNAADKAALHRQSGALAVDMESHIVAEYARRHGLPFAAIRAISDPAGRSLPDIASHALRPDGSVDLMRVMTGVVRAPAQIPALIAAGIDSNKAFASLRRGRGLLGPLFGLVLPHL